MKKIFSDKQWILENSNQISMITNAVNFCFIVSDRLKDSTAQHLSPIEEKTYNTILNFLNKEYSKDVKQSELHMSQLTSELEDNESNIQENIKNSFKAEEKQEKIMTNFI